MPSSKPPSGDLSVGREVTIDDSAIPAPDERNDMPLPQDPQAIFQGGLFLLALLAGVYLAREVLLPIVLAFILKLLMQPIMRLFARLRVSRVVASLLVILLLLGIICGLGELLSTPASDWAKRLPEGLPRLQERVRIISAPLNAMSRLLAHAKMAVGGANTPGAGTMQASPSLTNGLQAALLSAAHTFASEFLATFLILFFLLMSGDTFLRRLVEVMPRFRDKRQVTDISQQIEADISAYLVTVTGMNALVGIATGLAMWALGLQDVLLWGAAAFLLNFVPILGPLCGFAIFLAVGMLSLDPLWKAFMPMILYSTIHILEGETVTPLILARRFTLNPVLVIMSLLFWDWMWGVPGAILAVPILAIVKIICDRVRSLAAFGHFLEGEQHVWAP
ncbi:AI-2E family transporter [Dyella monticola]|nr:AI-2E family transporter [Dyella monticola]